MAAALAWLHDRGGVIPLQVATSQPAFVKSTTARQAMSVKPSDFWSQGRNISRNIFGAGRNIWGMECWSSGILE
jgi:hypothetical protein